MGTVQAHARSSVDELLAAIKQLPAAELSDFERQFAAWREQTNGLDADSSEEADEVALLARIRANSRLPAAEQRRFERLRRKRQAEEITNSEEKELQALWQRVEQMNVARLQALTELARRRGTDVKTLLRELGLRENLHVF